MNICEFPIEITNKNPNKTAIKEIVYSAYVDIYENGNGFDTLVSNVQGNMGPNFQAKYTIPKIKGYRRIYNSDYYFIVDSKNDAKDRISAKIVFVTRDNISKILSACKKDVKKILKGKGLYADVKTEEIRLHLLKNNDLDRDLAIKATYSKAEKIEQKDVIFIIVNALIIFVCIILAVGFKNNPNFKDLVSNSIAIAITLFISVTTSYLVKLLCKKRIKIDEFQQWIEGTNMEEKLQKDYLETEKAKRPKT